MATRTSPTAAVAFPARIAELAAGGRRNIVAGEMGRRRTAMGTEASTSRPQASNDAGPALNAGGLPAGD
jgi:hypothetical protein